MGNRANKHLLWMVAVVAALVIAVTAVVAFILPVFVESRLIPGLAAEFGLEPKEIHVRRIGWWGADLGPLQLQSHGLPVLSLAAIQIDYTPLTLLRGRIKGVVLGGLNLELTMTDDGVAIPGWRLPAGATSEAPAMPDFADMLPVELDYLSVIQSHIVINRNGRRHLIPLDISLQTAELEKGLLKGQIHLAILGNPMVFTAALDQHANGARLTMEGADILLDSLAQIGTLPVGLDPSGSLDLKGYCTFQLKPAAITSLDISMRLMDARLATAHGAVENLTGTQGDPQPIELTITAEDSAHFLWAGGPFQLNGPLKSAVTALKGSLTMNDSGWSLDMQADTLLPIQSPAPGISLEKPLPMAWTIEAARSAEKDIRFKVRSSGPHPLVMAMAPLKLTGKDHEIVINGRFGDNGADTASPSARYQFGFDAQAVLAGVSSQLGDTMISLPEVRLTVRGRGDQVQSWAVDGHLRIADGQLQHKRPKLAMEGLSVDLPLHWPPVGNVAAGRLDLRAARWEGRPMGGAAGVLQQIGPSLEISLKHRSKLFTDLIVLIKGRLNADGIHADVRIPAYQPAQMLDLGRFVPDAAGFRVGGRIEGRANVEIVRGLPRASAILKIDRGTLTQDAHVLNLDGIAMDLQIDDIAALKSAPRQKLRVENLQLGKLAARDLDVDFQLEDRQTLFVEKASLQWCLGRINTAAIRINPAKADYDVTLFCDRLNLAMVLEQLGAAQASGEGAVNGRIPVRWVDGRISFDNGFLYSTPGQPGAIKLSGTEALLAGMPPGSPQRTQLDIATEALKDYTYQWAKLSVQSEGDILLLKLQLDGKPNRLLPFAYDQQLGQFTRTVGQGQAEFKGISIDLNFKSPLNEIIHYKEFFKRN